MCEELGSEPIEEEIPIEYEDLTVQSQVLIDIYHMLPDKYGAAGYEGKDLTLVVDLFEIYGIYKEDIPLFLPMLSKIISKFTELENKKLIAKKGAK